MHPKYKLLEEHFNITRTELYKNILEKLKSVYGLDTNQIQADYCYRNRIESCNPLDPYEFNSKYREMIEKIVDDNLLKYGIITENDSVTYEKYEIIFDLPEITNVGKSLNIVLTTFFGCVLYYKPYTQIGQSTLKTNSNL